MIVFITENNGRVKWEEERKELEAAEQVPQESLCKKIVNVSLFISSSFISFLIALLHISQKIAVIFISTLSWFIVA